MKVHLKSKAIRVKNHVIANRWSYAWGVTAVSAFAALQTNRRAIDKFLKSKDIDPMEFWMPDTYKELAA